MCCSRPRQPIDIPQRAASVIGSAAIRPSTHAPTATAGLGASSSVFEYVGSTALTVVSPITRKTYRFEKPGARIAVDQRDRSWIAFVPRLALVR